MVRECHYVQFTFFSGHIKGENELMGHPIQYLLVGIRLKVEGFSGFLKQNKILNTAMKMKMRSFSLRS